MELQPKTSAALDRWLNPETWYKGNDPDMGRFYNFIDQYQREHGFDIDEEGLKAAIVTRVNLIHETDLTKGLIDIIEKRIGLAYQILDFLKRTRR